MERDSYQMTTRKGLKYSSSCRTQGGPRLTLPSQLKDQQGRTWSIASCPLQVSLVDNQLQLAMSLSVNGPGGMTLPGMTLNVSLSLIAQTLTYASLVVPGLSSHKVSLLFNTPMGGTYEVPMGSPHLSRIGEDF
jgi:hypothetical protein